MKKLFIYLSILITLIINSNNLLAFISKPVTLKHFSYKLYISSLEGNLAYGALELKLKPSWKTYWRTTGDSGFPLNINYVNNPNIQNIHILWLAPNRFYDGKVNGNIMESFGYKNVAILPFIIQVKRKQDSNIKLNFNLAVCSKECIPYNLIIAGKLSIKQDVKANNFLHKILQQLPKPFNIPINIVSSKNNILIFNFNFNRINNLIPKDIFIETDDFIFHKPEIITDNNTVTIKAPYVPTLANDNKKLSNQDLQFTIVTSKESFSTTLKYNNSIHINTLLTILGLAFLGGFILNLMPCVLPVIALKLTQSSYTKNKISYREQYFLTILGLFASFLFLACVIMILQQTAYSVGWGFHFQQPSFLIFMLIVLIFFSATQVGFAPLSILGANKMNAFLESFSPSKRLFHFLYGIIITLLATPCTAPFLGSAVAFSLGQPYYIVLLIFLVIALGLAVPYIILLLFPFSAKNIFPKAGNWLKYVKYLALFLLYGSALWILFILTSMLNILVALGIFIIIHVVIYIFLKTKYKLTTLLALFLLIIIPIIIPKDTLTKVPLPFNTLSSKKLQWHSFNQKEINTLAKNHIIFIHISATWCLTCNFNEINVLNDAEVIKALQKPNMYLIKGDLTNYNPKIMDFIKSHGRAGIPFDILIKNDNITIFNELLSKQELLNKLK
ncbi:Thiol:disulfide interchange protein DsbD [Candidatus Hepatincola sp. Av]